MRMITSVTIIIAFTICSSIANNIEIIATDNTHSKKIKQMIGKHNIGMAAGFTTGVGISYRYWIKNGYGIQCTVLPLYEKTNDIEKINFDCGITGLKKLFETNYVDLDLYSGIRYQYRNNKDGYYYNNRDKKEKLYTLGLGTGFEFRISRIAINLLFGIHGRTDLKDEYKIGFTGDSGIYFNFFSKKQRKLRNNK